MISHILKFIGLLCIMSVLAKFVPFGCCIAGLFVLAGLWLLTE